MGLFFASLLRFFLNAYSSRKTILSENAVQRKESEILLFFSVVLNRQLRLGVSNRIGGSTNRPRSLLKHKQRAVPSARVPSSVDRTTAI
jgi:hypothetical protein